MEFQVDCGTVEEANAYMQTAAFAENPAGVEIDPDSLLNQYRSGVPEQQLLAMPKGPSQRFRTSTDYPENDTVD